MSHSLASRYKYFSFMSMLYAVIITVGYIFCYKVISVYGYEFVATTFLMPLWFSVSDVITEVYGYKLARRLVWQAVVIQAIFVGLAYVYAHIGESKPAVQIHYDYIVNEMPRTLLVILLTIPLTLLVNMFILVRFKLLTRGKYYFIRSLCSTIVGLTIFAIITGFGLMYGKIPVAQIAALVGMAILFKIAVDPLFALIGTVAVAILRYLEGGDAGIQHVKFNPFSTEQ